MDDMAELCTFLEVSCRFDEIGIYDGEVIYRLYLGEDNCTDFNLKGNSVLKVNLSLTVDGLKHDVTWRVEPDYVIRDGYASGWISKGRHPDGNSFHRGWFSCLFFCIAECRTGVFPLEII